MTRKRAMMAAWFVLIEYRDRKRCHELRRVRTCWGQMALLSVWRSAADRPRTTAVSRGACMYRHWRWLETLHNTTGDSHLGAYAMTGTVLNVMSFLFLGFFLGMRHATDADHVVAIATIVSRERRVVGSALIGAAWGVGHTITVMAVGAAIIVFGVVIPPKLGLSMVFAVGIMLVLLGILTLTGMGRAVGAAHAHVHAADPRGHALNLHDHRH